MKALNRSRHYVPLNRHVAQVAAVGFVVLFTWAMVTR